MNDDHDMILIHWMQKGDLLIEKDEGLGRSDAKHQIVACHSLKVLTNLESQSYYYLLIRVYDHMKN